ncbi:GDSL-type esterase/lipase family protein [Coraliomargarita parva]|uniref:GDSL-type esterase/lipase family protein n=1 Tax=Coraliomargarita parva TaxID=3014050 RepID=UPI0022B5B8F7|nr:GDSL-type esterase/lipase family protein [Coraliomargarita parva]
MNLRQIIRLSLALTCAAAALSTRAAQTENPAATATPKQPWIDRHNRIVKETLQKKPDLVFLGDSITDGWDNHGLAVWKQHFGQYNPVNQGIAGDRTEHVLWRVKNGALGGNIQPKLVVLMIGTNNSNEPEQIAEGVGAIIAKIRERCPQTKVLLLDIFPRGESPDNRGRIRNDAVNALLPRYANDQTVFWLPIGHQFLEPDGTLSKAIMPDYLHPRKAGYEIWAKAIDSMVAQLMNE